MGKIIVAGIGPGSKEDITPAVLEAIGQADVVVGYKYYFQFIGQYVKPGCECIDTGMKKERERAEQAFRLAEEGKTVVVISSGDAGIYGMAPLIYQMKEQKHADMEVSTLPGISAFQKAASLLGAPLGHDTCIISLSDLMTPWSVIEKHAYTYARTQTDGEWTVLERSIRHAGTVAANYRHSWGHYSLNVNLNGRLQSKTYYTGTYEDAPGFTLWNL